MTFTVELTKRVRKRKLKDGSAVEQLRYIVNYRHPKTGKRRQEFFERQKEAQERKAALVLQVGTGAFVEPRAVPTVAEAVDHWLAEKAGKVKGTTLAGYRVVCHCITGPLLEGTAQERAEFTATKVKPKGAEFIHLLGPVKVSQLTTAALRSWHRTISELWRLHREPGQVSPQIHSRPRRRGLRRPSTLHADGAFSVPSQAEEGHPDLRRHPHHHRGRKGRP